MKFLSLILISFMLISCGLTEKHEEKKTKNSLESAQKKRDLYLSLINDPRQITTRCDGLTFVGLFDAYGKKIDIYDYEYPYGKLNRDIKPCYPDHSHSEISAEGLFGFLHAMIERGDIDAVKRVRSYLRGNNYIAGKGPKEFTLWLHFMPLLNNIIDKSKGSDFVASIPMVSATLPPFTGFRGNVIADYLYLRGKLNGYLRGYELDFLEKLVKKVPQNPIYHALYHRFTDGDQSKALEILGSSNFPETKLPEKSLTLFDWSDAPSAILYIYSVAIIEGR